jgi:hypothetical protein
LRFNVERYGPYVVSAHYFAPKESQSWVAGAVRRRGRERGDRQSKAEDPAATVSRDLVRGANNLARSCALPERNGCLSVYRAPRLNQNQKGGAHGPRNTALAARRANSHHHTHRSSLSLIDVAPAGFALDSPESRRPRQRRSSMAGSLGRCPRLRSIGGHDGQNRTRSQIQEKRGSEVQERRGPAAFKGIGDVVSCKRSAICDPTWKRHHWTRGSDFSTKAAKVKDRPACPS